MQLLVCTSLVMSEDKRTKMLIEAPVIHWWCKTGELHCQVYQLNMHFRALLMPPLRESNEHAVSSCYRFAYNIIMRKQFSDFDGSHSFLSNRVVKKLRQNPPSLYHNNLNNIAVFFTLFKGFRHN